MKSSSSVGSERVNWTGSDFVGAVAEGAGALDVDACFTVAIASF